MYWTLEVVLVPVSVRIHREAAPNATHILAAEVGQSGSVGNRIPPYGCGVWNGTSKLDFQAVSDPLLSLRTALRSDMRGWFGKRKERKEALGRFLLPLEVAAFEVEAAVAYGRIRATLERAGTPIGPLDNLIAAHALSLGVTLVTNNLREFECVPDLQIEDWTEAEDYR